MARIPTRRFVVASLASLSAVPAIAIAPAPADSRIVALDWGLAATMLALGRVPLGMPAPRWYDRIVVEPERPASVVDVGLLNTPSFEVLQELAPSSILIPPGLRSAEPLLRRIAPVETVDLFSPVADNPTPALAETRRLATLLSLEAAGEHLIQRFEASCARIRAALHAYDGRPLIVASIVDDRHVAVFGGASLCQAVLDRLGLLNAGSDLAPRGAAIVVGFERLASMPEARLLLVDAPAREAVERNLAASPLWNAMPFVRFRRIERIGSFFPAGGLPSALRLIALIEQALSRQGQAGG